MSMLLAAGADACIADKYLLTPLHYACKNEDPRLVDLLFLYSKDTNKVKISPEGIPGNQRDLGLIAQEDISEDEEEIIGLKGIELEEDGEEDIDFNKLKQSSEQIIREINSFREISEEEDEEERERFDYADQSLLLNFRDKLGRTALHYSAFYGSVGVLEDLTFLKANPYLEDAYNKRAIDLIQKGPKYDVLVELLTNNMKSTTKSFKGLFNAVQNNKGSKAKGGKKKMLKSLDIVDLQLISKTKILEERIGITFDNYLSFAIRNKNYEATKYLLSLEIFDLDFKNSSGFSYFHSCIIDDSFDLLKLLFLNPDLLEEPFDSKKEISEDIYDSINPDIFTKKIFELTSNKGNTILN